VADPIKYIYSSLVGLSLKKGVRKNKNTKRKGRTVYTAALTRLNLDSI